MTVVLDCNIFAMCSTSRSPYHYIYQQLIRGKFNLAVSAEIMLEYEEIIQQKYSVAAANSLLTLLSELPNIYHSNQYFKWQLIEHDADDNKYCDCAIAGQADYIITEDKHFEILKRIPFPSITTLNIDQFLEILQTS